MILTGDAAAVLNDDALVNLVERKALQFYADDANAPITWEPSAHDFLSPALAEATLMMRVLADDTRSAWLARFLPSIDLQPVTSADPSDGKLAHADGLNLSRGWMLSELAELRPELQESARAHTDAGLRGLAAATYAGTHWLPSFAVYLKHGTRTVTRDALPT